MVSYPEISGQKERGRGQSKKSTLGIFCVPARIATDLSKRQAEAKHTKPNDASLRELVWDFRWRFTNVKSDKSTKIKKYLLTS